MSGRKRTLVIAMLAAVLVSAVAVAQFRGRSRRDPTGAVDRNGVPEWKNDERFKHDVFTFVRIRYSSHGGRYGGYGYGGYGGGKWATDYPDSDLNFSFRLQQLTSLDVDPNGKILELTDDAIFDYPWLYIIEPGNMWLEDAEVKNLRKYCLNGGFVMVDDFWGDAEWQNFYENLKRVFPEKEPIELPLEHEIFQCVYPMKIKPQVPSIHSDFMNYTTDRPWDPTARDVHYRGVFDDKGRMMMLICHNTDLGDGWEREGESAEYFTRFSEKWSYPMGINIITYAMTH